jgi:hypothetical protein
VFKQCLVVIPAVAAFNIENKNGIVGETDELKK